MHTSRGVGAGEGRGGNCPPLHPLLLYWGHSPPTSYTNAHIFTHGINPCACTASISYCTWANLPLTLFIPATPLTSSVGTYSRKTRNAEFSVNILISAVKMSKVLYPLLERGLDLHTLGEKILLFQNLYKTLHKSKGILLQSTLKNEE